MVWQRSLAVPVGCDGDIDLVLAIDSSNSVLQANRDLDPLEGWNLHKDFLKSIVQNLPVGSSTKVSTVRFSSQAQVVFHFNEYATSINVQDALFTMDHSGGNTNTAEALRTVDTDVMRHEHGERSNARDILVILTDGLSNINQNLTGHLAWELKDSGFEIFAVATSREVDMVELASIASEPAEKYVFQVNSSLQLEEVVDVLVHRICGLPDPTPSPPPDNECMVAGCLVCEGDSTCSQCEEGRYQDGSACPECMAACAECERGEVCDRCEEGYYWDASTLACEVCSVRADLVLLLDTSGSIRDNNPGDGSYDNFQLLKNFVNSLLDRIETGPDSTRVATVQFSTTAKLEFHLDRYTDKASMQQAIQDMRYQGGDTYTADAIRVMREQVLLQDRGDRPHFPNIGLMITDGKSTINRDRTIPEAELAHQDNVTMFVVGVTDQINEAELTAIASDPNEDFYFNSTDIKHLDTIMANLLKHVCTPENPNARAKRDAGMATEKRELLNGQLRDEMYSEQHLDPSKFENQQFVQNRFKREVLTEQLSDNR